MLDTDPSAILAASMAAAALMLSFSKLAMVLLSASMAALVIVPVVLISQSLELMAMVSVPATDDKRAVAVDKRIGIKADGPEVDHRNAG